MGLVRARVRIVASHKRRAGWSIPCARTAREEDYGVDEEDHQHRAGARGEERVHVGVDQQRAELAAGDHEDHRVENVRDHLVELVQEVQHFWRDGRLVEVHVEAHHDDRKHCRRAHDQLGEPEGEVAHPDDRGDLDIAAVVDKAEEEFGHPAKGPS